MSKLACLKIGLKRIKSGPEQVWPGEVQNRKFGNSPLFEWSDLMKLFLKTIFLKKYDFKLSFRWTATKTV